MDKRHTRRNDYLPKGDNYDGPSNIRLTKKYLSAWTLTLGSSIIAVLTCQTIFNGGAEKKGPLRFCLGMAYAAVRLPRMLAFRRFRQELRFTKSVGPSELVDLNQDFDCFIAGSDQVWNDDINDGDPAYFLHFVDKHHKKFSYAASFGFSSLRNEQVQSYRERLVDFSVLSVREASAREIISGLLGRAAHVTLDPTLLLSATEWQDLISKERLVPQKYVLLYHITFSRELVEFAQRFARERGYRLIAVPFPLGKLVWHTPKLSVGPYEWVRLIRDAELVVTDSFHGCAFAINFNKDFVAGPRALAHGFTVFWIDTNYRGATYQKWYCRHIPPLSIGLP